MTRYAIDEDRRHLLASWRTGSGDMAHVVADLQPETDQAASKRLAAALSGLSQNLWHCYTHPASAAPSLETNTTGWRREGNREAFAEVIPAMIKPNLPTGGFMTVSYIPVEEAAHRVGRALHQMDNAEVTDLVTREVKTELEAVEKAELGDLSGRAQQAVVLTRADASPVQVAAADSALHADPLSAAALMNEMDPTAGAVATAHWLEAAAEVAAQKSGLEPEQIVLEADNIEALPCETPTLVLEALAAGESPHSVVTELIRGAMAVAEGKLPDIGLLNALVEQLKHLAPHIDLEDADQKEQMMDSLRVTPLDPSRPAPDLLEDLLYGIHGCWLIFDEYAEPSETTELDESAGDGLSEDDEPDDAYFEARREQLMAEFIEAVRAVAAENRDRLL